MPVLLDSLCAKQYYHLLRGGNRPPRHPKIMQPSDLDALKDWFGAYYRTFSAPLPEDRRNYRVKEVHTREVCANAVMIATDIGLAPADVLLAEAVGLLHDVGRFPQYRDYRTFDDVRSVNHAALGAKTLLEHEALRGLPKDEQDLIVRCVGLHNAYELPGEINERTALFARIVRDADKLDIWRVFLEYDGQPESERASAVVLGLDEAPHYSAAILESLAQGRLARKSDVRFLNDYRLLQLTWIYDLNFPASLRACRDRNYVNRVAGTLPRDAAVDSAIDAVRSYVDHRIAVEDIRP